MLLDRIKTGPAEPFHINRIVVDPRGRYIFELNPDSILFQAARGTLDFARLGSPVVSYTSSAIPDGRLLLGSIWRTLSHRL